MNGNFRRLASMGLLLGCAGAIARANDAIEPGTVYLRPTWSCMGINWHFRGDANRNAKVTLEFRREGTDAWREALPLWRHHFEDTVMFSGSVFRLAPGTPYEFRLEMTDPDGGDTTRTAAGRTLDYPRMPARTARVERGGLAEAQKQAEPGTVILLAKGTYPAAVLPSRVGRTRRSSTVRRRATRSSSRAASRSAPITCGSTA